MFTGIIEEVGSIESVENLEDEAVKLTVHGPLVVSDAELGASIAVSGVCLTVTEFDDKKFTADVMRETLLHTTLGDLQKGDNVNLERAVRVSDRLGGHIVQGHVDGTATISSRSPAEHWEIIRFQLPKPLWQQLVHKGSVAIDGTSLTVSAVGGNDDEGHWFEVSLIPTTLRDTTFGGKLVGASVNIETDVLAKYVQRLLTNGQES